MSFTSFVATVTVVNSVTRFVGISFPQCSARSFTEQSQVVNLGNTSRDRVSFRPKDNRHPSVSVEMCVTILTIKVEAVMCICCVASCR